MRGALAAMRAMPEAGLDHEPALEEPTERNLTLLIR
jgi:hypothetical protein